MLGFVQLYDHSASGICRGPPFQEVPLDPGWTVGVACLRVDLEEHGMVQGEDLHSEFVVGGVVQDGMPGQGQGS
jgi:hypothetical protein